MSIVSRTSKETNIEIKLELAGAGKYDVQTPNPFLTHMLETWTRYAGFDLHVRAKGDLDHHIVEDTAIALGQAFRAAFAHAPCVRIAHDVVPMDDALVLVAVDLVDRPYYEGVLPIPLWEHFLRSFAMEARINLHVDLLRGRDTHHAVEAAMKGFARALRRALQPRDSEISTKGRVEVTIEEEVPTVRALRPAKPSTNLDPIPALKSRPTQAAPPPLSLEEEEIMAELEKGGWSWREGAEKPGEAKALKDLSKRGLVQVRNVGKDGRPRIEARLKKARKGAEDAGTVVAPPKLGGNLDTAPIQGEDTSADPGAAHVKAESLKTASGEVHSKMQKRELPEVKAAKQRDREIHGQE